MSYTFYSKEQTDDELTNMVGKTCAVWRDASNWDGYQFRIVGKLEKGGIATDNSQLRDDDGNYVKDADGNSVYGDTEVQVYVINDPKSGTNVSFVEKAVREINTHTRAIQI